MDLRVKVLAPEHTAERHALGFTTYYNDSVMIAAWISDVDVSQPIEVEDHKKSRYPSSTPPTVDVNPANNAGAIVNSRGRPEAYRRPRRVAI